MAKYTVEQKITILYLYEVEADTAEEAEAIVSAGGGEHLPEYDKELYRTHEAHRRAKVRETL